MIKPFLTIKKFKFYDLKKQGLYLLNKGNFKNKLNKKVDSLLLVEWDKLRQLMWSENCVVKPAGFLSAIHKVAQVKDRDIFTGYAQNDLPEFLNFILECFHESIKREVMGKKYVGKCAELPFYKKSDVK